MDVSARGSYNMMSKEQAKEFASKWLPAWTGNDPEKLLSFYSDDAFYLDPAIPNGVKGKEGSSSFGVTTG